MSTHGTIFCNVKHMPIYETILHNINHMLTFEITLHIMYSSVGKWIYITQYEPYVHMESYCAIEATCQHIKQAGIILSI